MRLLGIVHTVHQRENKEEEEEGDVFEKKITENKNYNDKLWYEINFFISLLKAINKKNTPSNRIFGFFLRFFNIFDPFELHFFF